MVEPVDDRLGHVLQCDEVDHIVILIQVAFGLDGCTVIVAVESLALIALVRDEMPRAEDQVVLRDPDLEMTG